VISASGEIAVCGSDLQKPAAADSTRVDSTLVRR
jgi:hypothetical protein